MGVDVDEGERLIEGAQRGIGDAVVAANHDRERLVGKNRLHRRRDLIVRLRRDGGPDFDIANVGPALALEYRAVAVNVVKAFGQVVVVLLRSFAHIARSVALAGLSPSAFVEGNSQDGEIDIEFVEISDVRRAEKCTHADESGHGLGRELRHAEEEGDSYYETGFHGESRRIVAQNPNRPTRYRYAVFFPDLQAKAVISEWLIIQPAVASSKSSSGKLRTAHSRIEASLFIAAISSEGNAVKVALDGLLDVCIGVRRTSRGDCMGGNGAQVFQGNKLRDV